MRDFSQYAKALDNHITTELFFKLEDNCTHCEPNNCIVTVPDNRFCYVPSRGSVMSGKEVIQASLRSYFAFQINKPKWWLYMDQFDQGCSAVKSHISCAEEILKKLGYDTDSINRSI